MGWHRGVFDSFLIVYYITAVYTILCRQEQFYFQIFLLEHEKNIHVNFLSALFKFKYHFIKFLLYIRKILFNIKKRRILLMYFRVVKLKFKNMDTRLKSFRIFRLWHLLAIVPRGHIFGNESHYFADAMEMCKKN